MRVAYADLRNDDPKAQDLAVKMHEVAEKNNVDLSAVESDMGSGQAARTSSILWSELCNYGKGNPCGDELTNRVNDWVRYLEARQWNITHDATDMKQALRRVAGGSEDKLSLSGTWTEDYDEVTADYKAMAEAQVDAFAIAGLSSLASGTLKLASASRNRPKATPARNPTVSQPTKRTVTPKPGKKPAKAEVGGGGQVFTHYTDSDGAAGIAGVDPMNIGESVGVSGLQFGQGSNSFFARAPGDNFVTDLGLDATPRQLEGIGVFGARQQYAIQFSQEAALNSGVRPVMVRDNIFTIPGGSCIAGACIVTRVR